MFTIVLYKLFTIGTFTLKSKLGLEKPSVLNQS